MVARLGTRRWLTQQRGISIVGWLQTCVRGGNQGEDRKWRAFLQVYSRSPVGRSQPRKGGPSIIIGALWRGRRGHHDARLKKDKVNKV
jgi:hypothetical protein